MWLALWAYLLLTTAGCDDRSADPSRLILLPFPIEESHYAPFGNVIELRDVRIAPDRFVGIYLRDRTLFPDAADAVYIPLKVYAEELEEGYSVEIGLRGVRQGSILIFDPAQVLLGETLVVAVLP